MSRELKTAIAAFVVVAVSMSIFVRIDVEITAIGHVGGALVAITLLYAPVVVAWRRGEDLEDYGFRTAPRRTGLALGLGVPLLIVFPVFTFGYMAFYELVCDSSVLDALALPGACARYQGWSGIGPPSFDLALAEFALVQLLVVALPEELFFRGFLHEMLERAIPPKRRLRGGGVGWALVASSAAFALIHIPRDGDPRALATFFPGLLFGWMRSKTGSILAPTLAHAASNVFIKVLDQIVLS